MPTLELMNYTDTQLKQSLAKMLPERVEIDPSGESLFLNEDEVLDTELLHLCWLLEETLNREEQIIYIVYLDKMFTSWIATHATWQQRVIALCKVKGIKIV